MMSAVDDEIEDLFGNSEAQSERGNDSDESGNDEHQRAIEEHAVKTQKATDGKVITPKRVIRNPQPKLDADRLCGKRGIKILQDTFKDVKLKGKRHELEDLELVLKRMEHWAHRLFPKLPFDDVLGRIEKLGVKKPVQTHIKKIRMDMLSDEPNGNDLMESDMTENARPRSQSPGPEPDEEEVDPFDELMAISNTRASKRETQANREAVRAPESSTAVTSTLSVEMQQRIEENRRQAEERRKLRLLHQQEQEQNHDSVGTQSAPYSANAFSATNPSSTEPEVIELETKDDNLSVSECSRTVNEAAVTLSDSEEELSVLDIINAL
nr:EOG090X0AVC [Lepidurus arcticus]